MSLVQLYTVFGLPLIALVAAGVAIISAHRSARRVDEADANVQRSIGDRRRFLDSLAAEGVNGLEGKVEIAKTNIISIRRVGE